VASHERWGVFHARRNQEVLRLFSRGAVVGEARRRGWRGTVDDLRGRTRRWGELSCLLCESGGGDKRVRRRTDLAGSCVGAGHSQDTAATMTATAVIMTSSGQGPLATVRCLRPRPPSPVHDGSGRGPRSRCRHQRLAGPHVGGGRSSLTVGLGRERSAPKCVVVAARPAPGPPPCSPPSRPRCALLVVLHAMDRPTPRGRRLRSSSGSNCQCRLRPGSASAKSSGPDQPRLGRRPLIGL